jgi:hypothetical protein
MKLLAVLALVPVLAWANSDQCVLQERTVSQGAVTIQERSGLTRDVVTLPSGQMRCQVTFRARIGTAWHTAFGEYDWPGDRSRDQACAVAAQRAESAVRERVGQTQVVTNKVMICRDQADLQTLPQARPGTMAQLHQFRPHPEYPREFWHNGTQCRWFLDSQFRDQTIYTYQGIICRVQSGQWVVVDKF